MVEEVRSARERLSALGTRHLARTRGGRLVAPVTTRASRVSRLVRLLRVSGFVRGETARGGEGLFLLGEGRGEEKRRRREEGKEVPGGGTRNQW